jgi:nicotinate-nucleotide adenylyltransferase
MRGNIKELMGKDLKGKRIGIVGGTFNPIHLGHLRSAEENREAFDLFRVIFIPSATPPHKDSGNIIDAKHRCKMVKRAVSSNCNFVASDIELQRSGKSYTIDTLRYFKEMVGNEGEIYFIIGLDAFLEIETWMKFRELFEYSHFIVTDRPDSESKSPQFVMPGGLGDAFEKQTDGRRDFWIHKSGSRLYFQDISALDISSTTIRGLIKDGKSINYLVPESVNKYIKKRGLYN